MNRRPASTPSFAAGHSSVPSFAPSPMKAARCSFRRLLEEVEQVADHVRCQPGHML